MNYVLILAGPIVVALAAFTTYASMVRSHAVLRCSFQTSVVFAMHARTMFDFVCAAPAGAEQSALTGVDLVA